MPADDGLNAGDSKGSLYLGHGPKPGQAEGEDGDVYLRDSQGEVRVLMGAERGEGGKGPYLSMHGPSGNSVVVDSDTPGLRIRRHLGDGRYKDAVFTATGMQVKGPNEHDKATLWADLDGDVWLALTSQTVTRVVLNGREGYGWFNHKVLVGAETTAGHPVRLENGDGHFLGTVKAQNLTAGASKHQFTVDARKGSVVAGNVKMKLGTITGGLSEDYEGGFALSGDQQGAGRLTLLDRQLDSQAELTPFHLKFVEAIVPGHGDLNVSVRPSSIRYWSDIPDHAESPEEVDLVRVIGELREEVRELRKEVAALRQG